MLHLPQKTIPDMKSTVTCYDSKLSLKTGKHFLYIEIKQNQWKKRSCFAYPIPLSPANHRSYWPVTHTDKLEQALSDLFFFTYYSLTRQAKQKTKNEIVCKLHPLPPNISLHILHTVLYTFPKVLIRRIFLSI